jgi:serine/threonine protein kinase
MMTHAPPPPIPAWQGGELFNLLGELEKLGSDHARFYAGGVLSGLAHLHSIGIVYRDLKVRPHRRGGGGGMSQQCATRNPSHPAARLRSPRTCSSTGRATSASWTLASASTSPTGSEPTR